MTIQQVSIVAPVSRAIAAGATTPNPGYLGAEVWSTTTNTMMRWNGASWQASAAVTVGTTAPSNPAVGDAWIDTN